MLVRRLVDRTGGHQTKCSTSSDCAMVVELGGELLLCSEDISCWYKAGSRGGGAGGELRSSSLSPR